MMKDINNVFELNDNLLLSKKFGDQVKVIFTTKLGGVSEGSYKGNNLALHVGDNIDNVIKNREQLAQKLDVPLNNFVFAEQNHGVHVKKIEAKHCGSGVKTFESGIKQTDCLYTYEKNIPLACFYADCTPIYFYEPQKNLVGIIHAGWQGSVKNIVEEVIRKLKKNENIDVTKLKVIIGPNIKKESFEVKEDVYNFFKNSKYTTKEVIKENENNTWNIDIVKYNQNALIQNGLLNKNIFISSLDTFKEESLFSFRRNNKTGRMIGVIKL